MADNIITALETDSEFQELIRKYESPNFFSILGTQKEEVHTKFITCLIDPKENHKAGIIPVKLFIELINNKTNADEKKICINEAELENMEVTEEYKILDGRVDIVCKNKSLILVIENKILAKENTSRSSGLYQTDIYYDFFQNNDPDSQKCYIYLKPKANDSDPNNKNFMVIYYQELYDYVILPCINNENINAETKEILKQYALAISHPNSYNYGNTIINANTELRKRIFEKHKMAFEKIRRVMNDINRDKTSLECKFYNSKKDYINLIIKDQLFDIVPADKNGKKDYQLEKLVNDGLIRVDENLKESTELHYVRKYKHDKRNILYIIQIVKRKNMYMCCVGYTKEEDYCSENDIDPLNDNDGNPRYFPNIHQALAEAEKKSGSKSDNPGKNPKDGKLRRAGKTEYEGKTIEEIYASLNANLNP